MAIPLIASEDRHYSVWGEFITLRRTQGINKNLIYDTTSGTLNACGTCDFGHCNVRDLIHDFSFEPGYRVGMGYFTPNWTAELTYFWIQDAHAKCSRHDEGKVYFSLKHPDFSNDFEGADHGEAEYETGLQNAELNYYRYVTPRKKDYFAVAWLAGVRYTYLAEELKLGFRTSEATRLIRLGQPPLPVESSHYTIDTHNFMYGVQTGAVLEWNPWKWMSWDLTVKGGVAVDFARQHTHLRDFNDTVKLREYTKHRLGAPFIGDGILKFTLSPFKWWDVYLGYEVLYFAGIACAPDQLVKHRTDDEIIRTKGYAIYYGWFGGFMFNF